MNKEVIKQIISLAGAAQELATSIGIPNLFQPGLVREMIIADLLGHELIVKKHDADACDPVDPSVKYEYLACKEGGQGQLDRVFNIPAEKRVESLKRILRNKKIYFAVFYKNNQIRPKEIYEIEPEVLLAETIKKLDRSRNAISHVGFRVAWARKNGRLIYEDEPSHPDL